MGEVFDFDSDTSTTRCGGEVEFEGADITFGGFDAIDFVQLLFTALSLGTAGGTGAETVNEYLLFFNVFLLTLKSSSLCSLSFSFLS